MPCAPQAESMELQQMRDGKHTFKKLRTERAGAGGSGAEGAGRAAGRREAGAAAAAAAGPAVAGPSLQLKNNQNKKILSFAEDEEEA